MMTFAARPQDGKNGLCRPLGKQKLETQGFIKCSIRKEGNDSMKYGLIGCGVMGSAVFRALRHRVDGRELLVANRTPEKAAALAAELGCRAGSNEEAASCDFVVLAVKPQLLREALKPLQPIFQQRKEPFVLISMAAGVSISSLLEMAGVDVPVIRMMPNTPVSVGAGMIVYAMQNVSEQDQNTFLQDFQAAGKLDELPESLMNVGTCVFSCAPAWCFQMMEALADGGVACGLSRQKAQLYAAQAMLGSAALLLESGKHPGELKDAVCSPGGSTIQGVRVLEERGFRAAVMDAVIAACDKTNHLGK